VNLDGVLLIDSHIHIYPTREIGERLKSSYAILDYGEKDDVVFSPRSGVLDDAVAAMDESGVACAAVLNIFELPSWASPPAGRFWPASPPLAALRDDLTASNEWICGLRDRERRLLPFLSVHPGIMTASDTVAHVTDLFDHRGARGVKLHPTTQRIDPADPAMDGVYAFCAERGAPVIAHSGTDKKGEGLADLQAFSPVLERFPDLRLVLAHLGGGLWEHAEDFAAAHPRALFDLCEIIEWTDAENGPSRDQLGGLIQAIGAERVLMGSDFPWYDLDRTVDLVMDLPHLSQEEKVAIVGRNAATLLGLERSEDA
jgi:predicted TIM-barrel fold metal-dependent hydrolase